MLTSKIDTVEKKRNFPKLMQAKAGSGISGTVVLMTKEFTGTVVVKTCHYELGTHATNWDMTAFEEFVGSISITQE